MNTLERCFLTVTAAAALTAPVWAQTAERRANLTGTGGNDSGKCTIEVSVDGAADVEIRGDRGFLRTLSGRPAQWRRLECSGPLPANPAEFRFSGVDGAYRKSQLRQRVVLRWRSNQQTPIVLCLSPPESCLQVTSTFPGRG